MWIPYKNLISHEIKLFDATWMCYLLNKGKNWGEFSVALYVCAVFQAGQPILMRSILMRASFPYNQCNANIGYIIVGLLGMTTPIGDPNYSDPRSHKDLNPTLCLKKPALVLFCSYFSLHKRLIAGVYF